MAAWQGLQGYPIAGTQVAIGTFPLVLACTVCLADALNAISLPERIRQRFGVLPWRTIVVCQILGAAALVCFFAIAWCKLPDGRNYYLSLPRLDLPGSRFVRTDANTTQLYQSVARYLRANCDTFVTSPGVHSFYFWTGKRPPTYLNSTSVSLLSTRQEEQVLAGLNRVRRPLIVINDDIYRRWGQDASVAGRPFFRALRNDYVEIHRIPPISFYAPKEHRE